MRIRYRHPIALITTTLLACACGIVSGLDEYGARDDNGADGSASITDDGGNTNDVTSQVDGTSSLADTKPSDDVTPPEEDDAGPPPPELDASADVNGDAGPECPTNDSLSAPTGPRWLFRGSALSSPSGVVLTPDTSQQAGALYWNQPFTFNALDVTIKFKIEIPSPPPNLIGDGLGIALVSGASVPADTTGTGESLGFVNQSGYAFMVDTYRNLPGNDPAAPFFGARTFGLPVQWLRTHSVQYGVASGQEHTLRVVIANQSGGTGTNYTLSAVYDGNSIMGGVKLDNYSPVSGYLAIFAATGGVHALHRVTNVTFRAGKSGLCAVP